MESKAYSYYCDIVQGSILFVMFVAIQLAIYGISIIPEPLVNLVPQSAIAATLAPISQGDILLITVITGYGAIWGTRLISTAVDGLRELSNSVDLAMPKRSTS